MKNSQILSLVHIDKHLHDFMKPVSYRGFISDAQAEKSAELFK
jgi:hypothetical protein